MSVISNRIFKNAEHKMSSPYGPRGVINTSAGSTSSFHNGTDYSTSGRKLTQYGIEDGYCFASAVASDGANYVWVIYPRIKKAFIHYHLDTRSVSAGAKVTADTKLGTTGKTGKATGVHLHLGVRDLSKLTDARVKNMNWDLLRSCSYEDPEKFSAKYTAPEAKATATTSPAPAKTKGYTTGTYKVNVSLLNVRVGAGTNYNKKVFSGLTVNARAQVKKLNGNKPADGLVKGCVVTVSQVKDNWGKIPSGWICLDHCVKA